MYISRPLLKATLLPLYAIIVLVTTLAAAWADTPNVGDRVQVISGGDYKFARVKEIGTGDNAGYYLLAYEGDPSTKGAWWRDWNSTAKIFLVDANGNRIKDFHPRPGDPSTLNPGAKSKDFKAGDRVEVYQGNGKWILGTLTSPLENGGYKVRLDKFVGQGLPDISALPSDIRAAQQATKAPTPPKFPSMRPAIAEPAQGKATPGKPPLELTKKLIQYLWEQQSDSSATVNCDIHSLEIGAPRKWVINRDIGPADPSTPVYPVKARSSRRTYYSGHVVISEDEILYKVYIDAFGKWHVGADDIKSLKPLQSISYQ